MRASYSAFKAGRAGFLAALIGLIIPSLTATAAQPELTASDLPRIPAVEPAHAVETFHVKPGFHIELVASEPLVASPVALSFDEKGRLFVVEMIDYSERRETTPHLGRIRMLEDTNGDGIFDRSTVFADNLPWPTAVFCYNGGVLVGATPDILYLKDTNGDGKADLRETVFTGFAAGMPRINVQGMLNSFIWGLDNRIHAATSSDGGLVRSLRHPETPAVDLHGRDFVIEPRSMSLTSEAGGGQHGLSFDDFGRRFACNNSDHIRLFLYDDRYASRNPYFFNMPPALQSIAVDGGAAEVYRISPEEPWRVIRTRWRVAGLDPGMVEGGGRSAGYFTGATGALVYRGDAFPEGYRDNVFVGDAGGNLVHRKVLSPDDVSLKASRPPDEQNVEFAASRDTWFRPVQFANAPDGTLYVIDMYREVIEHPWSLPPNIKKFLDLNSGNNRGRIYRIVPDGFKQPRPVRLDEASGDNLASALASNNGWVRDTASRLIYERQDRSTIPFLAKLARESDNPIGRFQSLYALEGLDALPPNLLLGALDDPDPWVRVHAIRIAETRSSSPTLAGPLFEKLLRMAADPSNQVRFQLAFTLGEFRDQRRLDALAAIARHDVSSPWIHAAIASSLADGADEIFTRLAADPGFSASTEGFEFLKTLVGIVGARNKSEELKLVSGRIASAPQGQSFALVNALAEGLARAGSSLDASGAGPELADVLIRARSASTNTTLAVPDRVAAIHLLGSASYGKAGSLLNSLLRTPGPEPVQLAAVSAFSRLRDERVAADLVQNWAGYAPRVRHEVVSVLLAQTQRALALLGSMEPGSVRIGDLTTAEQSFLRKHRDSKVRELAAKVLGPVNGPARQSIIDSLQPALRLAGEAAKGRQIYQLRCSQCHRLEGQGFAVGPDLVTVKNAGKEKLLANIVDPSREVAPQYIAFEVETKSGSDLVGIIANETTSSLTIRQAYGKEDVIPRTDLLGMQSQGRSLMPEGLEQGLSNQEIADLLEFISTANR